MISCTEFIYAYSELFRYIEEREGFQGVREYWERISDQSIRPTLGACVGAEGVRGCLTYWARTLREEAADFRMEYDSDAGRFVLYMRHCPSKGRLLGTGKPCYAHYCEHCDTLYRRVLEAHGLYYSIDLSECQSARCRITVADKTAASVYSSRKSDRILLNTGE